MSDEEHLRQMCMEMIAMAQREYQDAIRPWVDQLVRMELMSLRPFFIDPSWIKTSEVPANIVPAGCAVVSQSSEDGTVKGFYDPKDGVMHIQEVSKP